MDAGNNLLMLTKMDWKCCSLVFLFGYKLPIFTLFSLKDVIKQSGFVLPIIAYVSGYDIEKQINTSQSMNIWFQSTESGWDLAYF